MMLKRLEADLQTLNDFLRVKTPALWLESAVQNISLLLIDHAHCERKAAATAITLISKYPEREELVQLMAPLAREELLHFEKVVELMAKRGIKYQALKPSLYATHLHNQVSKNGGAERLCDQLIIGAIIEARSCERFYALLDYLDDAELIKFYANLVKSEARHFEAYLKLVDLYGGSSMSHRINYFLNLENQLILAPDTAFRFHSGLVDVPALQN